MSSTPANKSEDYQGIIEAISEELAGVVPETGPFTESTDLTLDVQCDSASIMMLVFRLEEKFDVSVPLNELGSARTIGDLATLILQLKAAMGSSPASN